MKFKPALFVAALLIAAPVWAINKCVGADGKISYQDAECVGGKSDTLKISDNKSDGNSSSYNHGYSSGTNVGSYSSSGAVGSGYSGGHATHTGPRGGRFHYTESGKKSYVRKGGR